MAEQTAEGKAAEASSDNPILKYLGSAIFAAFVAFLTWLAGGSTELKAAVTTLAGVVGGVCALVTSLLYARYLGVLAAGAAPARSPERLAYVRLRNSLRVGGRPAVIYAQWLTEFLDAVDRFFGDAGAADRTLFPHAFGLKTPAPLWTAPALDRCLLLALVYPIVTIFLIWAVSGHVGPAEAALGLPERPLWARGVAVAAVAFSVFAGQAFHKSKRWKALLWALAFVAVAFLGAFVGADGHVSIDVIGSAVAFGSAVGIALALTSSGSGAAAIAFAFAGICAGTFTAITALYLLGSDLLGSSAGDAIVIAAIVVVTLAFAVFFSYRRVTVWVLVCTIFAIPCSIILSFTFLGNISVYVIYLIFGPTLVFALAVAFAAAVLAISYAAIKRRRQGAFLSLFLVLMILLYLWVVVPVPALEEWVRSLLLFLGLLTLLNAPFDWVSLGLTRALLRRGLELAGWWPFFLAIVDALFAAVIIALLALTMVVGVQAFDNPAPNTEPVLPLKPFFDGIAVHPTEPEYWWVYALLFSTMIPSIINLIIGGASLMRGVPGVPSLLLRFMPANRAVPAFDRTWIATVLTLQLVGGAILGIAVQFALIYAVFARVMPWFGLELLDMAQAVADFDLPGRIIAWL
jgi:hypothetical protein